MILVYLQDTINYMHRLDPSSLNRLGEGLEPPEVKDILNKEGEQIRYYKYIINEKEND